MSHSYEDIGLNNRLQAETSLPARRRPYVRGVDFDTQFEVQTDRLNASKINLTDFIRRAGGGTVLGTFSSSQALNLSSNITYNSPKANKRTFGKPIVAIYQGAGTLAANQIYPVRGGSVTLGRYDVIGGEVDYANYNGTSDQWRGMIIDTNGTSTQVITFAADWIFADYVTDEVA